MGRDEVIATLRAHELEIKASGVVRLSLFGSTVRGEDRPDSDIDLLAAFDQMREISLMDVVGIENQLSDLLGRVVELVEEGTLKPRVKKTWTPRPFVPSSDPVQRFEDILENRCPTPVPGSVDPLKRPRFTFR